MRAFIYFHFYFATTIPLVFTYVCTRNASMDMDTKHESAGRQYNALIATVWSPPQIRYMENAHKHWDIYADSAHSKYPNDLNVAADQQISEILSTNSINQHECVRLGATYIRFASIDAVCAMDGFDPKIQRISCMIISSSNPQKQNYSVCLISDINLCAIWWGKP